MLSVAPRLLVCARMIDVRRRRVVVIEVPAGVSARRRLELEELARYCGTRIEREQAIGVCAWSVQLAPEPWGWRARVVALLAGCAVEATGRAAQPDAAIWEAMCRIEQPLLDSTRRPPLAA